MSLLVNQIEALRKELNTQLSASRSVKDVEHVRNHFLGKKGSVTVLMQSLKDLSPEEKRSAGPLIQTFKAEAEHLVKELEESLQARDITALKLKKEHFDVTIDDTETAPAGHLHPYTTFVREIEDIFISMGYDVADGAEVETDYYNFTALNIPQDHPARDMYDTLWLNKPNHLLRTHTSPVQVHVMETRKPPFNVVVPGRVYRHEAVDASHEVMFWQCEGLFVDKGITLAHLFGTARTFLEKLFETKNLDIRVRPGFFPFVEPGVEIDMRCPFCKGGCSVCKKSTWVEVFPGGLVHPNVLAMSGIDPAVYSGFAFGFGLTRLAMLKYGIYDIRLFHAGKVNFLKQF